MKKDNKPKLPFSKQVVTSARWEFYIIAFMLFMFVWFDKDVSSIAILASISGTALGSVRAFYIWLCKHEHIMDKKIEYKKLGLDSSDLDYELENIENQEFDINTY